MPILMKRAAGFSHHGGMKSWRAAVIRCVLIGTIILVTLDVLRLRQAAEFSCPARDVVCLQAAINAANANGEGNTLALGAYTYTVTAVDNLTDGANGLPSIHDAFTIPAIVLERAPRL